jgi:hypothetical protein
MTPLRPVFSPVVPPNRDDDPGVLGNLPRSRPGRRSDKRGGGAAAPKRAPAKKRATGSAASKASSSSQSTKRPASPPRARAQQRPRPQAQRSSSGDPLSQAVQIAGKVAAVGVKTAAGIIKRLPGR